MGADNALFAHRNQVTFWRQFLVEIAVFSPSHTRIGLPSPVLTAKYAAPELAWALTARNGLPM
jgi:hypothetical protein